MFKLLSKMADKLKTNVKGAAGPKVLLIHTYFKETCRGIVRFIAKFMIFREFNDTHTSNHPFNRE